MFDKIIRAVIQDNPNINRDRVVIAVDKTSPNKPVNEFTLGECSAWIERATKLLKRELFTYECVTEASTSESLYNFIETHEIDDIRVELNCELEMCLCFRDVTLNDTCHVMDIMCVGIDGIHFLDGTAAYFEETDVFWIEFINNLMNKGLQDYANELYD